jgi:succinyl-CoA synthetase beta subunit
MTAILTAAREFGWVMEPDAKRLLALAGIPVPKSHCVETLAEALPRAAAIGYPIAAKVVSPLVVHKSEAGGVAVGIADDGALRQVFQRFAGLPGFAGVLLEEMVSGTELIVGAKIDYQFGPVVLLGIGGTGVEIYKDVVLRMAPVNDADIRDMIEELKGTQLLKGYRGAAPVNRESLKQLLKRFSELVMEVEAEIESIDLNPVMCSPAGCKVADARIMLADGSRRAEPEPLAPSP